MKPEPAPGHNPLEPAAASASVAPPRGWWLRGGKRVFDTVAAALGLLLLAPLLLALAAWIKLDSPGPVFFRQERVGRGGRPFRIHKFRTMRHAPQAEGAQITVGADARITRAGRWLRAAKLDELAQLIDVLRGDMSLVGPRPEVPRYVALYPPELRAQVLAVRPGITDLASIVFRDESTLLARAADPERAYREVILPRKLALAARYAAQASLATDLALILRTLAALVRRPDPAAPPTAPPTAPR
jgi:lipopolysaccharide/colanic/teichoic acid biosynthesis glycosyltransferase